MSAHNAGRFATFLTTFAVIGLVGAGSASAEPAGNAEVSRTAKPGAGSAQADGTAADGGLIELSATATGGDPDLVGGLLGGLLPGLGRSGPAVASVDAYVEVIVDLEPGTHRATVTVDDATGAEQADGDASSTATATATVLPTGTFISEQGNPTLGRDSADLGPTSDVVLEFEFEVGTAGSYKLGVDLIASAQADGEGSSAVTTVSSDAVDVEITPLG